MAALFRDFSFDAPSPSRADHEAERALMNCSPTSMPAQQPHGHPLTPPPCTMGDLAQLLGGHNLFISTSRSQPATGPPTPPSEDDSFPTHVDRHAPRPIYCRASAAILRMQRQAHARLLCCPSQARDMAKLAHMIEQEEQCCVRPRADSACASNASTSPASRDDAINLADEYPRLADSLFSRPLYRAGDRHNDSTRISKSVRMRKRSTAKDGLERRKTR
ncbi:hypothetical protein EJ07DRAFT_132867 [Lizonia empirigonia]|nr:hypothetical protein EJ07DRAFT_132867 [Lizonia empirigonia]